MNFFPSSQKRSPFGTVHRRQGAASSPLGLATKEEETRHICVWPVRSDPGLPLQMLLGQGARPGPILGGRGPELEAPADARVS